MRLADVALPVPVARAFTYAVSEALESRAIVGARVVCPFRTRRLLGVVVALREGEAPTGTAPLTSVVDEKPALPQDLVLFLRDLAAYYLAPIGEVIRLALPPVERETVRELTSPTLFDGARQRRRGVGDRHVQWVEPTARVEAPGTVRGQAAAVLAHLRAVGAAPVGHLENRWSAARAAVRRLHAAGLVVLVQREVPREPPFAESVARDVPHDATTDQRIAIDALVEALARREPQTFVLHGITGSGKTEVYLRAIAAARATGRGAIMLVPEIALTPQLVTRVRARFGDDVAVLHSALSMRERHAMWHRLRDGAVGIAVGARSALFAPVRDLSMVVVDEEHDPSFKQEEGVRYHARDMAILRAHRVRALCILGSATPSLEAEQLARTGRAIKLRLPARARSQPLPVVDLVDLRRIAAGPTGDKRISMPLYRALEATLRAGEQAILFLNRRGFAPSVRCAACGKPLTCESCSVALTFHKSAAPRAPSNEGRGTDPRGALAGRSAARGATDAAFAAVAGSVRCHYCDFRRKVGGIGEACPACHADALMLEGVGTEKLEESVAAAFPSARVARLDRDVATGRRAEAVLARMRAREVDILVGTQMVTKGHDLPNVTLVGVVNADAALSIPDFRAAERSFQLLVQVAGRAGRGDVAGRVVVQTWDPQHPAIALAARHDVDGFLDRELKDRIELGYPPITRAAVVRVDGPEERRVRDACAALAALVRRSDPVRSGAVTAQGPAPAPIARIRGRYRFRLMLRAVARAPLRDVLEAVDRARATLDRAVRASIDVDPVQLL